MLRTHDFRLSCMHPARTSEKSGPRLPSEQPAAALVAAVAMAAAAAMAPALAAPAQRSCACVAIAPNGAIAAAAAADAIAAAATIAAAGCSDGNLGPDFSDAKLRPVQAWPVWVGGRHARKSEATGSYCPSPPRIHTKLLPHAANYSRTQRKLA